MCDLMEAKFKIRLYIYVMKYFTEERAKEYMKERKTMHVLIDLKC